MPELSHINRPKPHRIAVDLGDGDILNLVFDRNRITRSWRITADEADKRGEDGLAAALAEAVLEWDVTDNGAPVEPDQAGLGLLSIPAQVELLRQIIESSVPSSAEGNSSNGPTSTPPLASTPPSPTPPSGPAITPSPTVSESPSTS